MNQKHKKHFNCQFPVVCSGMHSVSNVNLAIAVKKAGCMPSFVAFNHVSADPSATPDENGLRPLAYDSKKLDADLTRYYANGGDRNYILGMSTHLLVFSAQTLELLIKHRPAFIELFDTDQIDSTVFRSIITTLRESGIKVIVKLLSSDTYLTLISQNNAKSIIDGVVIKGSAAAGRVAKGGTDLITDVKILRATNPELIIIAQGGVHSSKNIIELQEAGADIVSIGTLFSLTEESSIPRETKLKMVASSYNDTKKIGEANQNGIVFSSLPTDVENNTKGLRLGIHTGKTGHVFAGAALDHVNEIKTVQQVVDDLTAGL
jgi:NAD(P)H-dependent flavin oxidoreductase YrpB (nitropropane dioxygenase family)